MRGHERFSASTAASSAGPSAARLSRLHQGPHRSRWARFAASCVAAGLLVIAPRDAYAGATGAPAPGAASAGADDPGPPPPPPEASVIPPRVAGPTVPGLPGPLVAADKPSPSQPLGGLLTAPSLLGPSGRDLDFKTDRYEPAGLPLLGGNSDIGFQFGAVGTLSHYANGITPYAWNMDLVVSASIKNGPRGPELVQQSYQWNDDVPGLLGGKLRVNPQVSYQRTINQGYFGLGNAASGAVPTNYSGPPGRYFEWIDSIANVNLSGRVNLTGPWSENSAVGFRYMNPTAYADSKVARDAEARNPDGSPVIRGLEPLGLTQLATGVIYDTRDNETFATRGAYHQLAIEYVQGIPTSADVAYGEAQLYVCGFRSLGPFVLAGRLVGDLQFGNVPFYDLFMSGPYSQSEAIGGAAAVRGVPVGRYSGEIKVYGNAELRSMFIKFSLLKQKITLGGDALFDTGRSWVDYTFKSPLDGNGVGLKYGVGGGIYVLWGQSALFRIDAAYSPDAAAENPHFPLGVYVMDGTMF